jgi:hypothetical protein
VAHKDVLKALKLSRSLDAIEHGAEVKASRRKPRSAAQVAATEKAFRAMKAANKKRQGRKPKRRYSRSYF